MREVRCGGLSRWRVTLVVALALFMNAALGPPARAIMKYGPLQISGNVDSLNLVRSSNPESYQFIMNRNVLRFRVDWDWLQNGLLMDRFSVPFIERSKVFLLYRGVYDGFYDIAPTDLQRGQERTDDLIGGPIAGNTPGQCVGGPCDGTRPLLPGAYSRWNDKDRSNAKFENRLREMYVDFKIKDAPLSFRLGRQQVIWGESDQFRVMDIWNPLDFTWHAQVESWDEIRIPMWLGKGLWDIGSLGPLSNTFLELVYNPFDFQDGLKVDFNPRPWSVPYPDPLRSGQIDNASLHPYDTYPSTPPKQLLTPRFNLQGTSLVKGDFKRNPQDASEVGLRFHAVTPQGFEFALDYMYGRARGLAGASTNALKITKMTLATNPISPDKSKIVGYYQPDINNPGAAPVPVYPIDVVGKIIHPYQHIFGMTGTYFEGDYTQSILRYETAYVMSEPFQTTDPSTLVQVYYPNNQGKLIPAPGSRSPVGFTKRDIWCGMVGFDRPTWIRFLNSKATWFLSAQFFWTYTTGANIDQLFGNVSTQDNPYIGPIGRWVSATGSNSNYGGLIERQQASANGVAGNGDQVRRWEHLVTMGATSFYRSGTVVPFIASAWDPVNDSEEILWNVDYFYSNNFIISLQQKFFTTYGSKAPSNDWEYTAGRFDRRDETGVRLTYQF